MAASPPAPIQQGTHGKGDGERGGTHPILRCMAGKMLMKDFYLPCASPSGREEE